MSSCFKTLQQLAPEWVAKVTTTFCVFLLAFALVLEYFVELTPCPLCIVQRFFFALIGLTAFVFWFWPGVLSKKIAGIKIMAYAILGGAIAMRQVWMQWYPQNIDSTKCGASFGSFIDQFIVALGGTGSCSVVDWTFLTLSIAEWSLLCFGALFVIGIWFLLANNSQKEALAANV